MPVQASEITGWLDLLDKVWPYLVVLGGLVGTALELRARKLVRQAIKSATIEAEEKWRRELQGPIGDIGIDALKALDQTRDHESRIVQLETKTGLVWRMIERSTADLLRREGDE